MRVRLLLLVLVGSRWCRRLHVVRLRWEHVSAGSGDGTPQERLDPVAVARNPNWRAVAAGYMQSCGVDAGGALYCWGDNESGELGIGTSGSTANKLVRPRRQ